MFYFNDEEFCEDVSFAEDTYVKAFKEFSYFFLGSFSAFSVVYDP